MRGFAGVCVVLSTLALFSPVGFADEVAVCEVVAVDETGLVTAKEIATGTTFQFKPSKAALRSLAVFSPLEADIDARVVFLGEQRVRMRSLRRGDAPPESARDADAADTARRSITRQRVPPLSEIWR
jgi:hypothetical protein